MSATQIALTPVGDGDVLLHHHYALDLADLAELLANILRHGGYSFREEIADRYPPRAVDLLIVELDAHGHQLRVAATKSIKDTH